MLYKNYYSFQIINDEILWNEFLSQRINKNLFHTYNWSNIKSDWRSYKLGFYKNKELIGICNLLIKELPLKLYIGYAPRGIIFKEDCSDEDITSSYQVLKNFGHIYSVSLIKFDPYIYNNLDYDFKKEIELFTSIKEIKYNNSIELSSTIQPVINAYVYKDSYNIKNLDKKRRYELKKTEDLNLEIIYGKDELIEEFYKLIKLTEDRKNIILRNPKYYKNLLKNYPKSFITLVKVDLKELKDCLILKNKNLKEIEYIEERLKDNKQSEYISGTLTIVNDNYAELLYAGTNSRFSYLNNAFYSWHKTLEKVFKDNINWCNLGGLESNLSGGLYTFKNKFKPKIIRFIGEFDLICHPFAGRILRLLYRIKKE